MAVLLPNTYFSDGQPFNGDVAILAFESPIFDDQPHYLGHRERLKDDELSNNATAIKARVAAMQNSLVVSVETGRTLRYSAGRITLATGEDLAISGGLITAPDNATSYVYIDPTGTVKCDTTPTVTRVMLAKVQVVTGTVSQLTDLRSLSSRPMIAIAQATKVFGGSSQVDKVCVQGETLTDGILSCKNFTLNAGIAITVDRWIIIYASGKVTLNAGSITVTPLAAGAAPYATPASTVTLGGLSGSGAGAGSGSGGNSGGKTYPFGAQPWGSGGGLGYVTSNVVNSGAVMFGGGGLGGGGIIFEAAGGIELNGVSITVKGGNAGNPTILSGSASISGDGGGSGGLALFSSLTSITATATTTIDVRGGNGGNALANIAGSIAQGGSPGGGGVIGFYAPSVNFSGANLLVNAGNMGANSSAGSPNLGGGGGGGFGGSGGTQGAGSPGKVITGLFNPQGFR